VNQGEDEKVGTMEMDKSDGGAQTLVNVGALYIRMQFIHRLPCLWDFSD
jgi:hypothetical protein